MTSPHTFLLPFATFIQTTRLDNTITNKKLEKIAQKLKKTKGRIVSNQGGFQSQSVDLDDPLIQKFQNECMPALRHHIDQYELNYEYGIKIDNLWFSINGKHHYNLQHSHPGSHFACSYYITVPKNSGKIVFINPDKLFEYQSCFWRESLKKYNTINTFKYALQPVSSLLTIFPAHLDHYVESNKSNQSRITLSFNFKVEKI